MSFVIPGSSASHLPPAGSVCSFCRRHLYTSSTLLVKRPQKPYRMTLPFVDAHGYPSQTRPGGQDRLSLKLQETLADLAERRRVSPLERYGSENGFGLKMRPRVDEDGRQLPGKRPELTTSMWGRMKDAYSEGRLRGPGAYGRRSEAGSPYQGGFGLLPRSRDETERIQRDEHDSRPFRVAQSTSPYTRSYREISNDEASRSSPAEAAFGQSSGPSRQTQPFSERSPRPSTRERSGLAPQILSGTSHDDIPLRSDNPPRPARRAVSNSIKPFLRPGILKVNSSRSYTTSPRPLRSQEPRDEHKRTQPRLPPIPASRQTLYDSALPVSLPAPVDSDTVPDEQSDLVKHPWQPTKKLSFAAMSGLKALHQADPETFNRNFLSKRFGISVEAVRRILRSDYRQLRAEITAIEARPATRMKRGDEKRSLQGTKWDRSNLTAEKYSPVPAIMRAYVNAPSPKPSSLAENPTPKNEK